MGQDNKYIFDIESFDEEEIAQATLNESNNWAYTFTGLLKYRTGAVGEEIVYSIREDSVINYETTITGFTITNKYNGPKDDIVPPIPNTGIMMEDSKPNKFYEFLMMIVALCYAVVFRKKVEE